VKLFEKLERDNKIIYHQNSIYLKIKLNMLTILKSFTAIHIKFLLIQCKNFTRMVVYEYFSIKIIKNSNKKNNFIKLNIFRINILYFN
jgi:hypothetical protein